MTGYIQWPGTNSKTNHGLSLLDTTAASVSQSSAGTVDLRARTGTNHDLMALAGDEKGRCMTGEKSTLSIDHCVLTGFMKYEKEK